MVHRSHAVIVGSRHRRDAHRTRRDSVAPRGLRSRPSFTLPATNPLPAYQRLPARVALPRCCFQHVLELEVKPMATEAQINANRRNAQKSTGPRSLEGKAATNRNALKHGLCAEKHLLLDEEDDRDRTRRKPARKLSVSPCLPLQHRRCLPMLASLARPSRPAPQAKLPNKPKNEPNLRTRRKPARPLPVSTRPALRARLRNKPNLLGTRSPGSPQGSYQGGRIRARSPASTSF